MKYLCLIAHVENSTFRIKLQVFPIALQIFNLLLTYNSPHRTFFDMFPMGIQKYLSIGALPFPQNADNCSYRHNNTRFFRKSPPDAVCLPPESALPHCRSPDRA